MFHTSELITWQNHKTIFLERTLDTCIALHPFQRLSNLIEDLLQLQHLRWIGLTIECTNLTSVTIGGLLLEVACHKGIKIGGNGVTAIAGHRLPTFRHIQLGLKPCPQVWLVEAREYRTGMIRHEDSIEIITIAVQGIIVTDKLEGKFDVTDLQIFKGNDDMFVLIGHRTFFLTNLHLSGELTLEVENDIVLTIEVKSDSGFAQHFLLGIGGNVEGQIVFYIADGRLTTLSELFGYALFKAFCTNALNCEQKQRDECKFDCFHHLFGFCVQI